MSICKLIQWGSGKAATRSGKPVCPECGDPAELVLGVFGQPCYAHKPKPRRRRRVASRGGAAHRREP